MQNQQKPGLYPIARARLGVDPSQRDAAIEAASRCTAEWPTPEEFERQLNPDAARRWDSYDAGRMDGVPFAYALINRDGEDPELVESSFRFDGAVTHNSRVADAAVSVLQAMRSIAASWNQMDAQTRASAQLAVASGRHFLRAAGVRAVGA